MDKIRLNTLKSLDDNFNSKGDNCDCWDRILYKLPCPCIISRHQDVLLCNLTDGHWKIEVDEAEVDKEIGKSVFFEGFKGTIVKEAAG